ncbi:MAG: PglZ domain-containing protein, partial [Cetobacterium sp.]
ISNNKIKYKPNNPTVPKCESLKEWEEWIINEYFPYKEYLDKENITISKELNEYILKFSDFYYSNYSYLKNSDKFISNILHDIGEEIREDEVSIILVIDNFNFSLKNILCRFLNEKKIKIAAEKFYFTTIPSETKFGKQALLRLSSLNFKSNWIVSNLTEIKTKFREKNIEYKNKISEINELEMLENMIYVVNYLEIDELLHTDNLKVAGEISDKVEHELEKISILLESILKKEKKLGIYIVTDHGSIKTYDKVLKIDNQIINTLTKNSGDIITEISKQDIAKNKFILESFGYILDKEIFLLDKNYYIAKQGIYFKNITGEKYLHGGISPDEICIPFIKIKNY